MIDVTFLAKRESRYSDGDWETGIDYIRYDYIEDIFDLVIEEVPILVTLTHVWKQESYYLENEEMGCYGPDMAADGLPTHLRETGVIRWFDFAHPEHIASFDPSDPDWEFFISEIKQLSALGQTNKSLCIPVNVYELISAARLDEQLHLLFERYIPDYDRFADYR